MNSIDSLNSQHTDSPINFWFRAKDFAVDFQFFTFNHRHILRNLLWEGIGWNSDRNVETLKFHKFPSAREWIDLNTYQLHWFQQSLHYRNGIYMCLHLRLEVFVRQADCPWFHSAFLSHLLTDPILLHRCHSSTFNRSNNYWLINWFSKKIRQE